ncbi:hypothetical protein [Dictyobacter arantiisoli]|uniref:Uncharacterized protein n=1 Tax=Dictyobacter arantiisoli TaxID=2014874 RepID=A0A5A5T8P4_9CHLR|nr:hypothetical protein [Dictyobacter arantiisoli]GCF07768.1 hypothetical protein KDI_13320 [Dictyobacter arantiisoli]
MHQSEVALLKKRIVEEYEAMKNGLTGLASGTAQHAFIDAKMRRVDTYHAQLIQQVGEQEAGLTVSELYIQVIG